MHLCFVRKENSEWCCRRYMNYRYHLSSFITPYHELYQGQLVPQNSSIDKPLRGLISWFLAMRETDALDRSSWPREGESRVKKTNEGAVWQYEQIHVFFWLRFCKNSTNHLSKTANRDSSNRRLVETKLRRMLLPPKVGWLSTARQRKDSDPSFSHLAEVAEGMSVSSRMGWSI